MAKNSRQVSHKGARRGGLKAKDAKGNTGKQVGLGVGLGRTGKRSRHKGAKGRIWIGRAILGGCSAIDVVGRRGDDDGAMDVAPNGFRFSLPEVVVAPVLR